MGKKSRVIVVGVAACLVLSSCTGNDDAGSTGGPPVSSTPSAPETASSTPTPTVTPTPTASPTTAPTPTATPSATATPTPSSEPVQPTAVPGEVAGSVFTTPDGIYSFLLPTGWEAAAVEPLDLPTYGVELSASAYVISDASGQPIARFDGGVPGDGADLPSPDHLVFDSELLPHIEPEFDLPVYFVFESLPDYEEGGRLYQARLQTGEPAVEGMSTQMAGKIFMERNSVFIFTSTLDEAGPASEEEARQWIESEQYSQLRAMLVSFTVNSA